MGSLLCCLRFRPNKHPQRQSPLAPDAEPARERASRGFTAVSEQLTDGLAER
jgi:hypothetical protein